MDRGLSHEAGDLGGVLQGLSGVDVTLRGSARGDLGQREFLCRQPLQGYHEDVQPRITLFTLDTDVVSGAEEMRPLSF